MNPKPLYQRLAEARRSGEIQRRLATETENPATRHEMQNSAVVFEKEAADVAEAIAEVEAVLFKLQAALRAAEAMKFRGAHSSLAFRHIEDAETRLQKELGTQP